MPYLILALAFLHTPMLCLSTNQWIDPHTMDVKHKSKLNDIASYKPGLSPDDYCLNFKQPSPCESDIYFKRILRILLSNTHFVLTEDNFYKGFINLQLSATDFDFLREFSQNEKRDFTKYSDIGAILEMAFQKTVYEEYSEVLLSFMEFINEWIQKPITIVLAGAILIMFVVYQMLKADRSWPSVVRYLIAVAYLADTAMTYMHLLEAEEIENMVNLKTYGSVPPECDPRNISWYNYLWSSNENCKKYYQATHQNVIYLVTPIRVVTHQFGYFIVEPLKYLGIGMGTFATVMYQSLPWGVSIILFPIMLLTSCILFCILLVFMTNTPVKINVFHLLKLEFGCRSSENAAVRGSSVRQQQISEGNNSAPPRETTVQHIVYVTHQNSGPSNNSGSRVEQLVGPQYQRQGPDGDVMVPTRVVSIDKPKSRETQTEKTCTKNAEFSSNISSSSDESHQTQIQNHNEGLKKTKSEDQEMEINRENDNVVTVTSTTFLYGHQEPACD